MIFDFFFFFWWLFLPKKGISGWNPKIALVRASTVVTYYIKLFRTGADRHNGILMSLLLLVAETNSNHHYFNFLFKIPSLKMSLIFSYLSSIYGLAPLKRFGLTKRIWRNYLITRILRSTAFKGWYTYDVHIEGVGSGVRQKWGVIKCRGVASVHDVLP